MEPALGALIGPIPKFLFGSVVFFGVLMLGLLSQRKRLSQSAFRNITNGAIALWLVGTIVFFYRLATHSG